MSLLDSAFDIIVWHISLLHKLSAYVVRENAFIIILSFPKDRQLKIVLDGQSSSTFFTLLHYYWSPILGTIVFSYLHPWSLRSISPCQYNWYHDDTIRLKWLAPLSLTYVGVVRIGWFLSTPHNHSNIVNPILHSGLLRGLLSDMKTLSNQVILWPNQWRDCC